MKSIGQYVAPATVVMALAMSTAMPPHAEAFALYWGNMDSVPVSATSCADLAGAIPEPGQILRDLRGDVHMRQTDGTACVATVDLRSVVPSWR